MALTGSGRKKEEKGGKELEKGKQEKLSRWKDKEIKEENWRRKEKST